MPATRGTTRKQGQSTSRAAHHLPPGDTPVHNTRSRTGSANPSIQAKRPCEDAELSELSVPPQVKKSKKTRVRPIPPISLLPKIEHSEVPSLPLLIPLSNTRIPHIRHIRRSLIPHLATLMKTAPSIMNIFRVFRLILLPRSSPALSRPINLPLATPWYPSIRFPRRCSHHHLLPLPSLRIRPGQLLLCSNWSLIAKMRKDQ
jgi:hypothetical protein